MATVQRVGLHRAGVHAEQIAQRRRGRSPPVQPPLAAGEQPVDHEKPQHLFPIGTLAGERQAHAEKILEMQRTPQLIALHRGASAPPQDHRAACDGREKA